MSELNSVDYYRARERHERRLAAVCADPAIAAIHAEMAARYSDLLDAIGQRIVRRDRRVSEA